MLRYIWLIGLAICLSGCTWVKLTEAGEAVSVAEADAISECTRVGIVTARTGERIITERKLDKVNEELHTLARNEAANLNADTIVPLSHETDGAQTFTAYRCH
ncbi:MAG: DUF4156 domain-containing protein [Proteobacteria bacterium]|nr:DUF4156 domain-containing protein [Pseudomonadota bacterium]